MPLRAEEEGEKRGPALAAGPRGFQFLILPAVAGVAVAAGLVHRLVDAELAAVELLAVGSGDGGARFLIGAQLHETEALGAAGVAIEDDLGGDDIAELGEEVAEAVLRSVVGEVADVEFLGTCQCGWNRANSPNDW